MMTDTDRAEPRQEARLRKLAQRLDLRICKSRSRTPEQMDYGMYNVVDINNCVVFGSSWRHYDATLDEVEAFLKEEKAAA